MTIFKLPDLGEGLPDAEIHEWFVTVGAHVKTDDPLVSMETAKAIVEVPSPQDGVILEILGKPGDIIKTGAPLVVFQSNTTADQGTVVGRLEECADVADDNFIIGSAAPSTRILTTPAVRLLAKKLSITLNTLTGTGEHGIITKEDVERAAALKNKLPEGYEPLRGVRRTMLHSMAQSHLEVVAVSIFDEVDIDGWRDTRDITVRLIQAISAACVKEPALNAWFDTAHSARKCFDVVNLGLAIDSDDGLFVAVINEAEKQSADSLRQTINDYKKAVSARAVPVEKLTGATFTLSNFGKFAGRFATPIIVPPAVAILAVGSLYTGVVTDTEGRIVAHKILPLSLSFDHRAVTGGEATRFLKEVIDNLHKS